MPSRRSFSAVLAASPNALQSSAILAEPSDGWTTICRNGRRFPVGGPSAIPCKPRLPPRGLVWNLGGGHHPVRWSFLAMEIAALRAPTFSPPNVAFTLGLVCSPSFAPRPLLLPCFRLEECSLAS
ncbi:hypothetical protein AMTR_s00013p00236730 [Amborella trichopoda]|uniref:Uncharacterized protein n=1 Tax=Amborella trichopoda TaxID=13333 RepID=W1PPL7_AMBTC|nr:hypothetical protein AMTR_s00013p00236730 [Amborella trichopoda]